jgi:hypothetical protein
MSDDEQIRLLREIARWTREAALPSARERVERLLDTDPKKRVYEALAQGTSSIKAVEKATGANHNDISAWVKAWESEGILEIGASPPKALFTLTELGIESAPPRVPRKKKDDNA